MVIEKESALGVEKEFENKSLLLAMVAPSFVVDFSYPDIICRLKKLGFDKVVELTFGAKMINREYHKILKKSKGFWIASPCPGITETIRAKMPKYKDNLVPVDSPMIAMGKICEKNFPQHKIVFISPCNFKKIEVEKSKHVDYVITYNELKDLFKKYKIKKSFFSKKMNFDSFYNDYTKIFPLSGGLAKTAHVKKVLKDDEFVVIDGINNVLNFLKNPKENVRFVDCLFCEGGCIGGPCTTQDISIDKKKKMVFKYLKKSKKEDIPEDRKGLIANARGLNFSNKY